MKYFLGIILSCLLTVTSFAQLSFQEFATGLNSPVDIANAGDGSNRLFVVQKSGQIIVFDSVGNPLGTFLNIAGKLGNASGERGLLGLAFHPNFATNGYFYLAYTSTITSDRSVIDRYHASGGSNQADLNSGVTLMSYSQPASNHNGGDLNFSPIDGNLYIATGDGGGGNDPDERAQNLTSPHGKMLRIDVSNFNDDPPYQIPQDNPFGTSKYVSEYQDTVNEIWAWGLRNPWRFSFSNNGDLWIGDVGQEKWEEVNFVASADNVPGLNYGWDCREGTEACGGCQNNDCDGIITIDPIHQYDMARQSITGGIVLEGINYPSNQGRYVFAEYVHDKLWVLDKSGGGSQRAANVTELSNPPTSISSFGKDERDNVYVASLGNGTIYKLVDQGALPIELVEVHIDRHEKMNLLEWETSFELNASHFEIERSRDAGAFTQIGIVPARGGTDDHTFYQFPDLIEREGHYFYRLKALDQDGSSSYSMILSIKVSSEKGLLLTPNPATSSVQVTIPRSDLAGELNVTDISGKLLYRMAIDASPDQQKALVDVSEFQRGLVMVQFDNGSGKLTRKLMLYR